MSVLLFTQNSTSHGDSEYRISLTPLSRGRVSTRAHSKIVYSWNVSNANDDKRGESNDCVHEKNSSLENRPHIAINVLLDVLHNQNLLDESLRILKIEAENPVSGLASSFASEEKYKQKIFGAAKTRIEYQRSGESTKELSAQMDALSKAFEDDNLFESRVMEAIAYVTYKAFVAKKSAANTSGDAPSGDAHKGTVGGR